MTIAEWLHVTNTKPSRDLRGVQFKNPPKPSPLGCGHGKPGWDKTRDVNGNRTPSEKMFRGAGYPRQSISSEFWSKRSTKS
jgi:hypothetical protein